MADVDGILDTCVVIDLAHIDRSTLPDVPEITTVTLAELNQGITLAKDDKARATRTEILGAAIVAFDVLPFDRAAATRYGSLVALTVAAGRDPRPRKLDLMIAAVASSRDLPLYTRDTDGFRGLDDLLDVRIV